MIFDNNIGDYIDNKEEDYLLISGIQTFYFL